MDSRDNVMIQHILLEAREAAAAGPDKQSGRKEVEATPLARSGRIRRPAASPVAGARPIMPEPTCTRCAHARPRGPRARGPPHAAAAREDSSLRIAPGSSSACNTTAARSRGAAPPPAASTRRAARPIMNRIMVPRASRTIRRSALLQLQTQRGPGSPKLPVEAAWRACAALCAHRVCDGARAPRTRALDHTRCAQVRLPSSTHRTPPRA